jgi:hypothetical protein
VVENFPVKEKNLFSTMKAYIVFEFDDFEEKKNCVMPNSLITLLDCLISSGTHTSNKIK